MRSAREAARLSLEQAGEELRIEPKFLAALEEERYDAIGVPVFAKGYLKLYCEYLGLDYARLLPLYEEKATKAPPLKGRHSIERRESTGTGMWLAVGIAVVVLVLFVLWLLRVEGPPATGTPATALAPEPAPSAEVSQGSGPSGPEDAGTVFSGDDGAQTSSTPVGTEPDSSPAAGEPAAQPTNAAASAAGVDGAANNAPSSIAAAGGASSAPAAGAASSVAAPGAASSAPAAAGAPVASGDRLDVGLRFSQDSWVEVTDSSSTRLYYGLGKAGDESHVAGSPPLTVLIGNADGVALEIDGKPYAYPRRRNGNVAYFTLKAPRE